MTNDPQKSDPSIRAMKSANKPEGAGAEPMERRGEFRSLARFDTVQAYYSIASRDLEREIAPLLESEKVGLLVWSPLAGGLLSGKFNRTHQKAADSRRTEYDFPIVDKERTWNILDVMAPIAKAHGCSPARLSLSGIAQAVGERARGTGARSRSASAHGRGS
jgi:aryl-alcohol dehydrogenase-like predicted oxidoreductase